MQRVSKLFLASRAVPRPHRHWHIIAVHGVKRLAIYIIALFILVVAILPVLWTISHALMEGGQSQALRPKLIPYPIYWGNFERVFRSLDPSKPVLNWFKNSVLLTGINVTGQILLATIAGYGFCRFRFRLRKIMFVVLMATMIVPPIVKIVPQYKMFASWGWTNTYLPLTLPTWFGGAFLTFLFYQYFCSIPRSLDESAMLDGANQLQIFYKIIIPLSTPILATAVVWTFVSNWTNFLEPYIYLHDAQKYTMAIILAYEGGFTPYKAAYILFFSSPTVLIFFLLQRYFVKGIQISILKE